MAKATPDDVNAQHLAAMGLAETPLGQPVPETSDQRRANEGRCPSNGPTGRCAGLEDHQGRHYRGRDTWDRDFENPSESELRQKSEDSRNNLVRGTKRPWLVVAQGSMEPNEASLPDIDKVYEDVKRQSPGRNITVTWNRGGISALYADDEIIPLPTKVRQGDQPLPHPGKQCVQDLIIDEMEESKRVGLERYGSTLQTFNGRKTIQDVAEEVRDLHVYLKQVEAEAAATRETLIDVVAKAYHPEPDGEDIANAEIAVDAIMGWVVGNRG